jgi:hypothetical protein
LKQTRLHSSRQRKTRAVAPKLKLLQQDEGGNSKKCEEAEEIRHEGDDHGGGNGRISPQAVEDNRRDDAP